LDGLTHRDSANVAPLADAIKFPLRQRGTLPTDIGRGQKSAEVVFAGGHIVISRAGAVCGYSPDLDREVWRIPDEAVASLISIGDHVFIGSGNGRVTEVDAATGAEIAATRGSVVGSLGAVGTDAYILRTPPGLTGVSRDGTVLWHTREASDVSGVSTDGKVLLFGLGREHIEVVDERTGKPVWEFRPPVNELALLHDSAIVGEHVVAVFRNGVVYRLRLSDGTLVAQGKPPYLGQTLIMEHAVAIALHDRLCEFDFMTMKEASTIIYDMVPSRPPDGLCVSRNAIVWTSDVGYVTGVSRRPGLTASRFWEQPTHAWGFMQTGVNPFVGGRFLYVQPQGVVALACFEMAAE
jgi:hypothetical protein